MALLMKERQNIPQTKLGFSSVRFLSETAPDPDISAKCKMTQTETYRPVHLRPHTLKPAAARTLTFSRAICNTDNMLSSQAVP